MTPNRILRPALLLALFLSAFSLHAQQPHRKRVAVVLSGGGAKGMAHIGALKVIERAGIPIDIITGTSMGSIIGGLYSIGWDAQKLDSMVRVQNWPFLLSDRADVSHQSIADRQMQNTYIISKDISIGKRIDFGGAGVIQGKNLMALFAKLTAGYRDSMDFNRLPIPFACVATNIVDNTEYDFHSGILAEAMRTSMSIPGAFAPIRKGDKVLVDGGLRNNYPVDIARQMGADVVIGVTVQGPPKTADDLKSGSSVISQIVDVNCKNKYDDNMAHTDVLIRANTKGYSAASFTPAAIDTLIKRGEDEAMKHWDELVALKRQLGLSEHFRPQPPALYHEEALPRKFRVGHIRFTDVTASDEQLLRERFKLERADSLTAKDIDHVVASMRVDLFYSDADCFYHSNQDGSYDVDIVAKEKNNSKLNLGVRFDTEEIVALQAQGALLFNTRKPLSTALTLRLGKRVMAKADLQFMPIAFNKMTLSYIYRHNDLNAYEEGDKAYSVTYNEHMVHLNVIDFNVRNFNILIGARFDYFRFQTMLAGAHTTYVGVQPSDEHLFSYHADVNYNSEDLWYFPTRGAAFQAGYGYYTNNLTRYRGQRGFSALNGMWRMNLRLLERLTLQPMIYGRLLFGREIPWEKQNVIGGNWFGQYSDHQMPFAGMGHFELADRHFLAFQLRAQQRIAQNNYVLFKVALAQHAGRLGDLLDKGPLVGTQAGYCYNSMFGPLAAMLGYSTKTHKPYFYINLGFVF